MSLSRNDRYTDPCQFTLTLSLSLKECSSNSSAFDTILTIFFNTQFHSKTNSFGVLPIEIKIADPSFYLLLVDMNYLLSVLKPKTAL